MGRTPITDNTGVNMSFGINAGMLCAKFVPASYPRFFGGIGGFYAWGIYTYR
jgi:hypothetical protein